MNEKIKVVLADDHPLLTAGLKMSINGWEEFEVVGIASNGIEVVELCERLLPDLIIMDMQMPLLSGPEAIKRIKVRFPTIRIMALTTFDDAETVSHAMEAGCDGFLLKVIAPDKLKASLLSVAGGINVYDESVMTQMKRNIRSKTEVDFSGREIEILRLVCQGLTNAEIAGKLSLRPGTVKNLISLLLSKSCCISRAQLVKYATENRLIE